MTSFSDKPLDELSEPHAIRQHSRTILQLIEKFFGKRIPVLGAEVGVWSGDNAQSILRKTSWVTLYLVDEWKAKPHTMKALGDQDAFDEARRKCAERMKPFAHRSKELHLPSTEAASKFTEGVLDFVYIDADHVYESVKADIEAWLPKVNRQGFIAGHDYNGRGDRKGFFGVKKAVDEIFGEAVNVGRGLVWWVAIKDVHHKCTCGRLTYNTSGYCSASCQTEFLQEEIRRMSNMLDAALDYASEHELTDLLTAILGASRK